MAKKSITEEAKEMLSSWKKDIEEKDGDILERKKKRDEENERLNEELKRLFKEVSEDIGEKGRKAAEVLGREFKEFAKTLKEGTADIYKKAEIEKHTEQFLNFLGKIKSEASEKLKETLKYAKSKFSEDEFPSEVETGSENKKEAEDFNSLIKQAEEEIRDKG